MTRENTDPSSIANELRRLRAENEQLRGDLTSLQEAESRFRGVFDNAVVGIFHSTPEGRFITVNRAMAGMLGYDSPDELIQSVTDIRQQLCVDPGRREEFRRLLDEHGTVSAFETEVFRKDGSTMWASISGRAVRDSQGSVAYYEGMVQDITEHKRAEEELAQAERRYREMFENSVEGIFQTTPEGRYLAVNPALARMYGYDTPEELLTTITDIGRQLYVDQGVREEMMRLLEEKGAVSGFESRIRRRDGGVIWTSRSIRAIRDTDGAVLYYEGFVEDITERKQAEEEFRAEHLGLRVLVETSPVGVLGVEATTRRVLFANRELERIWGFAHRQEFGLEAHAQAFVRRRPDGRAYEPEELPIERALVSGENVQGDEMVFEVPDGRRVRTLVSATPVYAEDGRITSAIAIIQELASVGPLAGPTPSVPTEAAQIPVPTGTATETALRIECASATDRGCVRETNEDAVYCEPVGSERVRDRGWLCAVADGMGGAAAGEVASDTALRTLVQHYYDPLHPQNIHEAAQAANAAVHEAARGRPEYEGMGTTLTAAAIVGERLHIAHVGDSRAYLVRRGEARQITQDHSWVAELVRAGALTNEQARAYRYRNILSRALGRQPEVDVDGVEHNLEPGDRFVLCSDGLSNLVGDGEIARVASSEPPQAAADGLVELANSRGGLDNISAIVVAIS